MDDRETLRSLIGGRWAVSWQGFLLGWPFALAFVFFTFPAITAAPNVWQSAFKGLAVGVITYIPVGLVFWLASLTVLKHRSTRPAHIVTVALIGGTAWTARTIGLQLYIHQQGLSSRMSLTQHLIAGFIEGVVAAVSTAWVLATLDTFHTRRRELLGQLVERELATERLSRHVERMRADVLESVRRTVREAGRGIEAQPSDHAVTMKEIASFQTKSRQMSREIAHDLWQTAAHSSRLSPWRLLRSAVANRPFAYWACLPTSIVSLVSLSAFWPVGRAALLLLALAAYSTAISLVANMTVSRLSGRGGVVAYLVAVIVLAAGSAGVVGTMLWVLDLESPSGIAIVPVTVLNFGVLVPLLGLGAHLGVAREDVLEGLRRSIDETEIEQEALRREGDRLRRDLAMTLHGGLQADLTSMSMRARHAMESGDAEAAGVLIDQARELMNSSIVAPDSSHTTATAAGAIDSAIGAWARLAKVTCDVRLERELPTRMVTALEEILLEGIGNAFRHGSAREIQVSVDQVGPDVRITIMDNGTGVSRYKPGLGSAVFDELAPGAWALTPRPSGGAILTVTLAGH